VSESITWTNCQVRLGELKEWEGNPAEIGKEAAGRLVESFNEFGQVQALAIDPDNRLIDGHQRLSVWLHKFGADMLVDCRQSSRLLTDKERQKIAVYLRSAAVGRYNWDIIANWDTGDLKEWGFDSHTLDDWNTDVRALSNFLESSKPDQADAEPQIDRAAELNEKWQVKTGDLWQIGEHRLLCGDSTVLSDVEKLIFGNKVFVFSDPTYGIDVVSGSKVGGAASTKFGKVGVENWVDSHEYPEIIGDDSTDTARNFYAVCTSLRITDFILWGGNYFTDFLSPSRCWLVWDKQNTGNFADVELAWTSFDKSAKKYEWLWNGLSREGNRKDELTSRVHPTQKPVGLTQEIMNDFPADIYYDGFLGSGSFMVAAHNVGKKMYGIEKSVDYCAVILERMATAFPELEITKIL